MAQMAHAQMAHAQMAHLTHAGGQAQIPCPMPWYGVSEVQSTLGISPMLPAADATAFQRRLWLQYDVSVSHLEASRFRAGADADESQRADADGSQTC